VEGVFDTTINISRGRFMNYLNGLIVARDLMKRGQEEVLDAIIEDLQKNMIETMAIAPDVETR